MRRGACALVRCMKSELPRAELIEPVPLPNCVWLKTLNVSHLKSKPDLSLMANRLERPKSKLSRPGRYRELRPTLPNVSPVGTAKAAGLKKSGPNVPGSGLELKPECGSLTKSV